MFPLDDTIAAIASAHRNAVRGIIRLSGPQVFDSVRPWFHSATKWDTALRATACSGNLRLDDLRRMPCELYVWPTRRSYTRQPTIELHTVGCVPLLELALRNLCQTGARLAQPGEFTLRAFLSGRLDLTQAEAVLGVIDAEGQQQFEVALRQLAGGISQRMNKVRDQLLDLCADLEAGLDFVEEDIEFVSPAEISQRLAEARGEIAALQDQMQQRTVNEQLAKVTLLGNPNVGKSSLLNALADEQVAIVSPSSGTTRDFVTKAVRFGDLRCELVDTAGLQVAQNRTSAAAQRMTAEAIDQASLKLHCFDASQPLSDGELAAIETAAKSDCIVVWTKIDLTRPPAAFRCDVATSSTTREGLAELVRLIESRLAADGDYRGETVGSTAVRCRESLSQCEASLQRGGSLAEQNAGDELIAAELRVALDHLGQVVGAVYTDDVLDRVFSRFCIGK